jgi:ferredoxin-fold anticodon binding domain-containing protein
MIVLHGITSVLLSYVLDRGPKPSAKMSRRPAKLTITIRRVETHDELKKWGENQLDASSFRSSVLIQYEANLHNFAMNLATAHGCYSLRLFLFIHRIKP